MKTKKTNSNPHSLKVGQQVWMYNPAEKADESNPKLAKITYVGKRYFHIEDKNRAEINLKTLCENVEWKPVRVYTALQDFLDEKDRQIFAEDIRKKMGTWGDTPYTLDQLKRVQDILNEI